MIECIPAFLKLYRYGLPGALKLIIFVKKPVGVFPCRKILIKGDPYQLAALIIVFTGKGILAALKRVPVGI